MVLSQKDMRTITTQSRNTSKINRALAAVSSRCQAPHNTKVEQKMKFTKKRDYNGSIRKVWDDNKTVCFGIIGTVSDLLKIGILEYANCSHETWAFIPAPNMHQSPHFGETKENVLKAFLYQ